MTHTDPKVFVIFAIAFLSALTVHEFAHARAALAAGDDTAKQAGRLTLNPLAHLDLVGSIFFIMMMATGYGIGWAKPVPINPMRFKSPRWDNLRVSLWGPLSNLIFAIVLSAIFKFVIVPLHAYDYYILIYVCIRVNVGLAVFNLIPIPPLDGSHILASLLPYEMARRFEYGMGRYGMSVLIGLVILGMISGHSIISAVIYPPIDFTVRLLLGRLA
ncbi:MAG TPA: site-2 protease family protein [Armatimonadota bacterium]|jgi:Zn-dependent protease